MSNATQTINEISTNEISTNAQKIIAIIGNTSITDPILEAWDQCMENRTHKENSKGYIQRRTDVNMAHVRHCNKIWRENDIYHSHQTWGELAESHSFGEMCLECRLAIIAGGFSNDHIQKRGLPQKIQIWFRENVVNE